MKKFIFKVILIISISALFIVAYCELASVASLKYNGPNTEEQVRMSFNNAIADEYNCYFLGNSRIYRGINPDVFDTVNSYNFAHDNDSYNQMYYKLLYLMENNEPIEYLIIGIDYFQFSFLSDTRNYIYSLLLPKEYGDDFEERSWIEAKEDYYTRLWTNKQNVLPDCIKLLMCRVAPATVNYQKKNGQYVVNGNASPDNFVDRDYTVLDVQYEYFQRILSICEENNIELYVIMPPLWEGETSTHTDQEREEFNMMIRTELTKTPYADNYINYSEEEGLSSYQDFTDVTHLKPEAADEYSEYINEKIFGKYDY